MTAINSVNVSGLGAFYLGMRHHDFAKSFFLAREKHALLGFTLLATIGRWEEALAALFHHNLGSSPDPFSDLAVNFRFLRNWLDTLKSHTKEIPNWIWLTSPLDQLAASAYSLAEEGAKPPYWSVQNPFSRLPVKVNEQLACGTNGASRKNLHASLWKQVFDNVVDFGKAEEFLKKPDDSDSWQQHLSTDSAKEKIGQYYQMVRQGMASPYSHFPERTYPAANDTALLEHGRLTAALALVVGANLRAQGVDCCSLFDFTTMKGKLFCHPERVVQNFHQALLLRLSFRRWQELFEQGIRLDDLHGVKRFLGEPGETDSLTYRRRWHEALAGAVAEAVGDKSIAGVLEPLNDFAFDLVYLLPASLEEKLPQIRSQTEEEVRIAAACRLAQRFQEDFAYLEEQHKVKTPTPTPNQLQKELKALAPIWHFQVVQVERQAEFKKFKGEFATELFSRYRDLWRDSLGQVAAVQDQVDQLAEISTAREVCDVCRLHPPFADFYDFYQTARAEVQEELRKVMYEHREEEERLCRLCLALRVVSHGTGREDWLREMLTWETDRSNPDRIKVSLKPPPYPFELTPPPALVSPVSVLKGSRRPEDMQACFVRVRRPADGPDWELEVFPTTYCAADTDGNLALLRLEAVGKSDACYDYRQITEWDNYKKFSSEIAGILGRLVNGQKNRILEALNALSGLIREKGISNLQGAVLKYINETRDDNMRLAGKALVRKLSFTEDLEGAIDSFLNLAEYQHVFEDDFQFFKSCMSRVLSWFQEQNKQNLHKEALYVSPHLARVLTRIRWIDEFYQELPGFLREKQKTRTLTLEGRYPRLLLLVPAVDLPQVLAGLLSCLGSKLFSSVVLEELGASGLAREFRQAACLWLLRQILPAVLVGALVVFKARQPLYTVLTESGKIVEKLKARAEKGLTLGLADLRGGLGIPAPGEEWPLSLTFPDGVELLPCLDVPRRDFTQLADAYKELSKNFPHLYAAARHLLGAKKLWGENVKHYLEKDHFFKGTAFIKRASKS